MGRLTFTLILLLFLFSVIVPWARFNESMASSTIYIRADGSVEGTNMIQKEGSLYTFTADIYGSIIIQKNDITIDGMDYKLLGAGAGIGMNLTSVGNVTIKNLEFKRFRWGIHLYESSNNVIIGNKITDIGYEGIEIHLSSNNTIIGNSITNIAFECIELYMSSNNSIIGNDMITVNYGFDVDTSSNNRIVANNVTAENGCSVSLKDSSNNSIIENVFTYGGLMISASCMNVVERNVLDGKPLVYLENVRNHTIIDAAQVVLVNCSNIRVESLTLSRAAVSFEVCETNNSKIINNVMIEKGAFGIRLYKCLNNSVVGNTIANKWQGIWLFESSNNSFYKNNFVNNTWQIFDVSWYRPEYNPSLNIWDDGYPNGGNYWSNYYDVDQYRGSNQNETGSDDIWDHPYVIDERNRDNYPIVSESLSFLALPLFMITTLVAVITQKKYGERHAPTRFNMP